MSNADVRAEAMGMSSYSKWIKLFTRNIEKMKEVLVARGLQVRPIERDRQGTPFFEICDPDGNEIEVVQAS